MPTHFDTFIEAFAALDQGLRFMGNNKILYPPDENGESERTPRNAVTFASMPVDGVHYAVLKVDGAVSDDSPVVQVSPMDSEEVFVLAASFLEYLAIGCDVTTEEMFRIIEADRTEKGVLVPFLQAQFDDARLFDDKTINALNARFGHLIKQQSE